MVLAGDLVPAGTTLVTPAVDIHQGLYVIYIYCDLLEHRVVGDALASLLSIIPVE